MMHRLFIITSGRPAQRDASLLRVDDCYAGTQLYSGLFGESVTTDSNELIAPVPSAFATYQIDDEYVIGVGFYLPGSFCLMARGATERRPASRPFVLQPLRRLSPWT